MIRTFTNIRFLTLSCHLNISLTVLSPLIFLKCLELRVFVIIDELSSDGVRLESVKMLGIDIHAFRREDITRLSMDFVPKHFPNLRYFVMYSSNAPPLNVDMKESVPISLPESCQSLHTQSENVLTSFGKADIRNLYLESTNVDYLLLILTKQCLSSLRYLAIESVFCDHIFEALTLILKILHIGQQLNFIAIDVSETSALQQKFDTRDDFERVRDWFKDRKFSLKTHPNLEYMLLGNILLTFKTSSVSSKHWISMKHFDAFHYWSRNLFSRNLEIIDFSA